MESKAGSRCSSIESLVILHSLGMESKVALDA